MTSPVHLAEGAVFAGDYRVVRPLSEGGMGAVYVVEQLSTGKQRALKVMHPALVNDPRQRQRFVQEAKIGAKIESDHVVEVLGAGVDGAMPWLVMELLVGETLEDRVEKQGPRAPAEVRQIFAQLCHAVAAAHDVGVVHRDLKAENVFLAQSRRVDGTFNVKVLDFGIAKLVAESGSTTQAIGSPLWMPPEQANTDAVITPASDVWPLGLLAFYSLTGTYFWKGAHVEVPNPMSIVMEVCFDPLPTVTERARELGVEQLLPKGFEAWFERCVNRDPNARFQSVRDLASALERLLGGEPAADRSGGVPKAPSLLTPEPMPVPELAPSSSPNPARAQQAAPELDLPKPKAKIEKAPTSKPEPAPTSQREPASQRKPPVVASPGEGIVRDARPRDPIPVRIEQRPRAATHSRSQGGGSAGIVTRAPRPESSGFPVGKVIVGGVVVLGGLFAAQHFLWTKRTPAPEPAPVASTPPTVEEIKSTSAKASASVAPVPTTPCPKGMVRLPPGELSPGDATKTVESYCLDVSEVTVQAYAACIKSGKCTPPAKSGNWFATNDEEKKLVNESCNFGRKDRLDHPINCVDATQADAYCKAQGKRLPTDVEWQWAARDGNARFKFPWGFQTPDVQLCWSTFTKRTSTCPVASHPKGDDSYGVHDLAGNVREWTSTVVAGDRVHCGSDWTDKSADELFKLGYCGQASKTSRSAFLGFRCAK